MGIGALLYLACDRVGSYRTGSQPARVLRTYLIIKILPLAVLYRYRYLVGNAITICQQDTAVCGATDADPLTTGTVALGHSGRTAGTKCNR